MRRERTVGTLAPPSRHLAGRATLASQVGLRFLKIDPEVIEERLRQPVTTRALEEKRVDKDRGKLVLQGLTQKPTRAI